MQIHIFPIGQDQLVSVSNPNDDSRIIESFVKKLTKPVHNSPHLYISIYVFTAIFFVMISTTSVNVVEKKKFNHVEILLLFNNNAEHAAVV